MMHKAWSSIKEVPYCFSRSYVKLQGHTAKKSSNLTQIGRFRAVTPVWIHWWIWNNTQSLMLYGRRALLFVGVIHQISRSHGRKIDDLNPIWVRLLGRSQLSNPSDLPCSFWTHTQSFYSSQWNEIDMELRKTILSIVKSLQISITSRKTQIIDKYGPKITSNWVKI